MRKTNKIILIFFIVFLSLGLIWFFKPFKVLSIKSKLLIVEIADTPKKRQQGLQNRTYLGDNKGMLFVFDEEGFYSFWMKDTHIPLDIAFINNDKVIVDIRPKHR